MAYIKSSLIGIVTLFIATVAYIPSATFFYLWRYPLPPGGHVGVNVLALIHLPIYWLIAIGAFALGFYWRFRRIT